MTSSGIHLYSWSTTGPSGSYGACTVCLSVRSSSRGPSFLIRKMSCAERAQRQARRLALGLLRPWPVAGSRCLHEPPRTRCCMQAHGSTTSDACICGNTKACCEAPHGLSADVAAARYAVRLCACQRIPEPTDQPASSQHGSGKSAVYTVADGDTLTAALQGWARLLCEPLVRPRGRPLLLCLRSLRPQQVSMHAAARLPALHTL